MTNKEKAREISLIHHKEYWYEGCDGGEYYNDSVGECEASALEMAEWKDNRIREVLEREISRANKYHDEKLSTTEMGKSIRAVSVLSDILGIEFPYDKLHMNFITLD